MTTDAPAARGELASRQGQRTPRQRLLEARSDHLARASELAALARRLTQEADPGRFEERDAAAAEARRAESALAEIDEALRLMDSGSYGHCQQCGDPIPPERLEAVPETRTCIRCVAVPRGFLERPDRP